LPTLRPASLLTLLVLVLTLPCAEPGSARAEEPRRPNIIFILTDDQGYGDISAHGNPVLKTPHLDRLHGESVRFTDFHVSPTCSPTRSSLLTGRHEFRNGVTHTVFERERLSPRATTIAQVLKGAGYRTGIFGKWHLGDEPDRWPSRRGFDEMFIHGAGGIGQTYPGSCGDAPGNTYFDPAILHNGRFVKTRGYCTDIFFEQATRWMDKEKGRKPFFAYITPNAPHAPLQVPAEYEKLYSGRVPPNTAKFFGMIANIDDNVGKLMAKLKEWGIERETLVVFMNDNGGTEGVRVFNAGMRGAKVTPWLGGTRASSFWRWPGVLQPVDRNELAAHIDVFPTLADVAGARLSKQVKEQVEGRSLTPLLAQKDIVWPDRTLVTHVGRWEKGKAADAKYRQCSIRNSRYHLVCARDDGKKSWQLFDVKSDFGEQRDIAAENPAEVARLDAEYDRWWESVQPQLVNEDAPLPAVNPFRELYWKQFGRPPNVVVILADDLGYGDPGCYNPSSKIPTPNIDRLAAQGMRFTDAHSPSSVCTPTRYGLLTGRYSWRTRLKSGVLLGYGTMLIEPRRPTIASFLREVGYATGGFGKWHLGLGAGDRTDYAQPLRPGPITAGFETYFGIPSSLDFPPYLFFDGDRPVEAPTATIGASKEHRDGGVGFWRAGAISPGFKHEDVLPKITERAEEFVRAQDGRRPFFLYLPLSSPHTPWVPVPEFRGKSGAGWYGDFVAATDASVGRILRTLDQKGFSKNTLVIVTSDNGGHWLASDIARWGHRSNAEWRGQKADIWEGGHRVPFIARWPGRVKSGARCGETICLTDLFATLCEITGFGIPADAAEDSFSILPLLRGETEPIRDAIVHHSGDGLFAIRAGRWKLVEGLGSGGFTAPNSEQPKPGGPAGQLYDLEADPREERNLYLEKPAEAARLSALLNRYRDEGRSR
jgi:arylsulfatase A-like enzyme